LSAKLILKNMQFYSYHGALPPERELGQRFSVSLEVFGDLQKAIDGDDLADSLDYARVYGAVKEIVEKEQFNLIETLADAVARAVLDMGAEKVKVKIKKLHPPLPGPIDYAGVEIVRKK